MNGMSLPTAGSAGSWIVLDDEDLVVAAPLSPGAHGGAPSSPSPPGSPFPQGEGSSIASDTMLQAR